MAIQNIIKSVQNIMRKDAGVDGDAQRLSQLVWMLFLKIFYDRETQYELVDPKYKSPIPEELRWRNWASDSEGITGDELLDFVNNNLFKKLKELRLNQNDDPRGFIVKEVFEDAFNYMKSGTLIRQVINKINEINFNHQDDLHHFNEIYEHLLRNLQSAGNAGEYYTPRAITTFIVDMLNPRLGEIILDPSCGTGGFLINAIEHIRKSGEIKTKKDELLLQSKIRGIELKPLPHLLAITNLILHGIEIPQQIRRGDMLSSPLRDYGPKDFVDIIATNPPFGGTVKDGTEANFPTELRTKETADLFLVLFLKLLKNGGRAGIVLPDGSLAGGGVKMRIREKFLKECNMHTIIRLPNSVFAPYATVATNLLFFTKGEPTKDVWYYEHKLPEKQKSYSKTKPIDIKEFDSIKKWWNDRKENKVAWKVSIKYLEKQDWDLDIKNPNKKEEENYKSPQELLDKIKESLKESQDIVGSINDLL
mgnify:FL=1